jgi:uncharacterized membrane protein
MSIITGTFSNRSDAQAAVSILESRGIEPSEISLILSEATHQKMFNDNVNNVQRACSSIKVAGEGAVIGGTLGAIIAGLTAVGTFTVAGFGLLVSGPIVAVFIGAGAGAATGTVAGALIGAGIPDVEANEYEKQLANGKALVTVYTEDISKALTAKDILKSYSNFYKGVESNKKTHITQSTHA